MSDEIVLNDKDETEVWIDGMLVGVYPKIKLSRKAADAIGVMMHDVFDFGQTLKADEVKTFMEDL